MSQFWGSLHRTALSVATASGRIQPIALPSPDFSPRLRNGGVRRGPYAAFLAIPPAVTPSNLYGRATAIFGVRELAPAFPTADLSAVDDSPRRVAASKSGDESPHSESPFRRAMVRSPS